MGIMTGLKAGCPLTVVNVDVITAILPLVGGLRLRVVAQTGVLWEAMSAVSHDPERARARFLAGAPAMIAPARLLMSFRAESRRSS